MPTPSAGEAARAVKRATVAIINPLAPNPGKRPFQIIGSGFCVHKAGLVVTCNHVHRRFLSSELKDAADKAIREGDSTPFEADRVTVPYVLFPFRTEGTNVWLIPVPAETAVTKTDKDLAVLKVARHTAFPDGYPIIPVADYSEVQEMMEVATCGFPLGEFLHDQVRSVTSTFTKGVLSAVLPVPDVAREHVTGFQLNITAAPGNSGGPVFSPITGRAFGVLSRGVFADREKKSMLPGIVVAEPIYPLLADDTFDRLLSFQRPPSSNG